MSADIFVSYDRDDQDRAQQIVRGLEKQGYTVWWDVGLRGGQDYRERIEQMLNSVRCVVVVWSRHSINSRFVPDERHIGLERNVLIPVTLDEGIPPPMGHRGLHTRDLSGWTGRSTELVFRAFLEDVAAIVAGAPMRPADRPSAPAGAIPAAGQPPRAPAVEPGPAPTPTASPPAMSPPLPQPRTAGDGKPRWGRFVVGTAVVLGIFAYIGNRAEPDPNEPGRGTIVADTMAASDDPAASPAGAAASVAFSAVLADQECVIGSPPGTPLERRVLVITPLPFRVDTATHLLMDQNGQPVAGAEAGPSGTLRSRRIIVAHVTGGAEGNLPRTEDGHGGVHLLIGGDGTVRQQLPFDQASPHAGLGGNSQQSIGVGMENLGPLEQRGDAWYSGSTRVPPEAVAMVDGRGWHRYTDAQVTAFFQVSCALRQAYPTIDQLVGHGDVSTTPRVEPGPAFPLDSMRARLFPQ